MFRLILKNIVDKLIALECLFVRQENHAKKRVLIFRKDVLGDFIIFLPTLKHYREYYKDYEISLVVPSMALGLIPLLSFIDDIIIFDQKKFRTNFWYRRAFIKNLARKGFDVAIYPVYSSEKIGDIIMEATRAPDVFSFSNVHVEDGLNELDKNMSFVSKIVGEKCQADFPTINVSRLSKEDLGEIISEHSLKAKKYIVIVPGAGVTYKMWPLDKMSAVADFCIEKGYTVVLSGTESEKVLGLEMIKRSNYKDKIVSLVGETSLLTLAHILVGAKLYFGNDTGTLHLAAAVGTPAVAVMGGGHLGRFFPYGNLDINKIVFDPSTECKGDEWKCAENIPKGDPSPCVKSITIEAAKKQIDELLEVLDYNNTNEKNS